MRCFQDEKAQQFDLGNKLGNRIHLTSDNHKGISVAEIGRSWVFFSELCGRDAVTAGK